MTVTTDPTPAFIHTGSPLYTSAAVAVGVGVSLNPGSSAWPTASLAMFVPFRLPVAYTTQRAFLVNGAVVSGSFDIGVYNEDFTQVAHTGSTAQAGTNATQYVAFTPALAAGSYYLAIAIDNTTATIFATGLTTVPHERLAGILQQAAAFPLPAPMVPTTPANAFWPIFGLTRTTSGF